jgi:hypothetical protein
MNVALIGCTPSEIISACQLTISRLVKEGHKIYAIIPSSSNASESSPSSSAFSETLMVPKLAAIGIAGTFFIDKFDYSAITQINADAVNSYIKDVKPSMVIMPSWKSPNNMRRILARTSLIACRGIGTILMYELDAQNTNFHPTVTFEMSREPAFVQGTNNNLVEKNGAEQNEINVNAFTKDSLLKSKASQTNHFKRLEEKFESHRTLLLEEQGLF